MFCRWAVQRLCGEFLFSAQKPSGGDAYDGHPSVTCCSCPEAGFSHDWVCRIRLDTSPAEILFPDLDESFTLRVDGDGVHIHASTTWGALHAVTTIKQLISIDKQNRVTIPFCIVKDKPRHPYRGVFVDTRGEHNRMHSSSQLRELLDLMAYVKMNALRISVDATTPHNPELVDRMRIYGMRRGVRLLVDFPTNMNKDYLHINKTDWMCINQHTQGGIPKLHIPPEADSILDDQTVTIQSKWKSYMHNLRERFATMRFLMDVPTLRYLMNENHAWVTAHLNRVVCVVDLGSDDHEEEYLTKCERCILVTRHADDSRKGKKVPTSLNEKSQLIGFEERSTRVHNVVYAAAIGWSDNENRVNGSVLLNQIRTMNLWTHTEHAMDKIDVNTEEFRAANKYRANIVNSLDSS